MAHGNMYVDQDKNMILGQVCTRSINERFWLVENQERQNDKSPSHIIMGKAPAGHSYQSGFAYKYTINKGDMAGSDGFNLLFNDPDFGDGIWFSTFPTENGWDVSLKRDQRPQEQAA